MRPIPNREDEEIEPETAPVTETPEIEELEGEEDDDPELWLDVQEF